MAKLRLSAYSHKGGVGRTTTCFALLHRLQVIAKKRPDLLIKKGYEKFLFLDWDKQVNLLRLAHSHHWDGSSEMNFNIDRFFFSVRSPHLHKLDIGDESNTIIIDDCSPNIDIIEKKSFLRKSDKIISPVNGKLSMYGVEDLKQVFDNAGYGKKEIILVPMNVPRSFRWSEDYLRNTIDLLKNHQYSEGKNVIVFGDESNINDPALEVGEPKLVGSFVSPRSEFIYSDRNFVRSEQIGGSIFSLPYCKRSINVRNMKTLCDYFLFGDENIAGLEELWD